MIENFDYRVDCDDFLLYELGRLIEEDRASFEDEEFRRVIEEGIHEHIERRLNVRADLAYALRSEGARREWKIVEDVEAPLGDRPAIVQSYTTYLFRRLDECAGSNHEDEVARLADQLFDSLDDRAAAMWPLPRHFILYSLKPHTHEDIPFRWFQLLVEMDEPSAAGRILEEVLVHGTDPDYREDLASLTELLGQARDPEIEDKIMQVMNSEGTPKAAVELLTEFLRNTKPQRHEDTGQPNPWAELDRIYAANRKYLAACPKPGGSWTNCSKKNLSIRLLSC